jgi:hypothetical protein
MHEERARFVRESRGAPEAENQSRKKLPTTGPEVPGRFDFGLRELRTPRQFPGFVNEECETVLKEGLESSSSARSGSSFWLGVEGAV